MIILHGYETFFRDFSSFPNIKTLSKVSDHVFEKDPTGVNNFKSENSLHKKVKFKKLVI